MESVRIVRTVRGVSRGEGRDEVWVDRDVKRFKDGIVEGPDT